MATRSFSRSLLFSSCRIPSAVLRASAIRISPPIHRNLWTGVTSRATLPPSLSWTRILPKTTFLFPHELSRILQFSHSEIISALRTSYFERGPYAGRNKGPQKGPWSRMRYYIDRIPHNVIFYGILGTNILVYLAWSWAIQNHDQFRRTGPYRYMMENFTVSLQNFRQGRIWTLLTASFSHSTASHALMNALTFYFMAPAVLSLLGNTAFLGLYLGGGVVCSAVSLLWNNIFTHRSNYSSHGASGAVYSVLALYACAFPTTTFLLFFVIPVPAWACMTGIFAWDLYQAIIQKQGNTTDSAGHVGGILGGVLFYLRMRNRHMFF